MHGLLARGRAADTLVRVRSRSGVPLTLLGLLVAGWASTAVAGPGPGLREDSGAGASTAKSLQRQGRAACLKRGRHKRKVFLEKRVPWMKGNQPNVLSLGALVVDLDTGQELFARKPDQPRPIASISKLAAALVVMEKDIQLEELTTIKKVDAEVARGGAPSRLLEGMTLANRDLLHAALMGSDNRAVSALGRSVGLPASQLAAAMTKKAQELGLRQTRFLEPTGLSPENVSTPREIITMLRAAMEHPVLGPVLHRLEYDAHPVARPAIHYVNTHRPAARANTQVIAGKTGYNDYARYCLVLVARVGGRQVAMAFLGTEGKLTRFGDVARVADWLVLHPPAHPPVAPAVAKAPLGPIAPVPTSSLVAPEPTSSSVPASTPASAMPANKPDDPALETLPPVAVPLPANSAKL
jgi:D-alanyl-D-alanine endopeptidase (penicillin-binding protein 7)